MRRAEATLERLDNGRWVNVYAGRAAMCWRKARRMRRRSHAAVRVTVGR